MASGSHLQALALVLVLNNPLFLFRGDVLNEDVLELRWWSVQVRPRCIEDFVRPLMEILSMLDCSRILNRIEGRG